MASEEDDQTRETPSEAERRKAAEEAGRVGPQPNGEVPPIDFVTFVLSLSTSAALHLGIAEDPSGSHTKLDLPLARQTIDLLSLLEEKTEGNLTGEEERLLQQVLYDLRMEFIAKARATGG